MLYSCIRMATMAVKGLTLCKSLSQYVYTDNGVEFHFVVARVKGP